MPRLHLSQQRRGRPSFHREIRLLWCLSLDHTGRDEDFPRDEPLLVDVVDDRPDVRRIEHRVDDEEAQHGGPEVVVLEVGAEAGAADRSNQPVVAAQRVNLPPAKRGLDGEIGRSLHEVVRHPLRERQRQLRRADVLTTPDVQEPLLLEERFL